MFGKSVLSIAFVFLLGCQSPAQQPPMAVEKKASEEEPIQTWSGELKVLHSHPNAPRSNPLYVKLEIGAESAVLSLGSEVGVWSARIRLQMIYGERHYYSLASLIDTGGYTEEMIFTLAPLKGEEAVGRYVRIVNNYQRENSHPNRTFSIFAEGNLHIDPETPKEEEVEDVQK